MTKCKLVPVELWRELEPYLGKHGQLARSCNICALEAELAEVTAQRDKLQELINAPEVEPALVVEVEPDYWSGGHYYEGSKPHINPLKVWKLPIGTKLYTAPPAPSVPPVRSTGQWESSRIADYNRGWNACREAMLAATPQQEPLSDERILSIGKRFLDRGYYQFEGLQPWVYSFARAIEREILRGTEK